MENQADSKPTKHPSAKSLNQFIKTGGYALLDKLGEGPTSQQRQLYAWNKQGTISKLQQQTQLTHPTLYLIKDSCPTSSESPCSAEGFFLSKEKYDLLTNAQDGLKSAEKTLKNTLKLAERSWIVDTMSIKMQNEIGGIDIQEAFKNELANAQKGKSEIEQMIETALDNINQTNMLIWDLKSSAKKL
jgi:hypothetical protein